VAHGTLTHEHIDAGAHEEFLYGIIAEFEHPEQILRAAKAAYAAGYRKMDAYTPFAVEGLDEELGFRDYHIPWTMFVAGVLGAIGGFGLLYWTMAIAYPLNVGGRPLVSWPQYIPITFETTVLGAALAGVFGMFIYNGLPQPYHPVFDAPDFDRASSNRFFLCIENDHDPRHPDRPAKFDRERTWEFLESLNPLKVAEVERRK
jgi:hypothetical protein